MGEMAVRALHTVRGKNHPVCVHDGQPYPCETIQALGPDPLDPPLELPQDEDGYWPADPRKVVSVRSGFGEAWSQVVEASSLVDALEKAAAIPFSKWIEDAHPERD